MTDDREHLGRLVRETWVAWACEQRNRKLSWLTGWDNLDDGQREVDMRIGSAVAARAVADAGLENTRRDAQLFALAAERDRVVRDLKRRADRAVPGVERDVWMAAVEVAQSQERSDGKEPQP